MSAARDVVIVGGARTAIGSFGGALKDVPPTELAATHRARGRAPGRHRAPSVGQVVFGNVIHTETKDMYLSRVAAIDGGLSQETPAFTLNRLCGSGLQAIVSAAQAVLLGDTDVAVAGGAESMSRGGYLLPAERWGQRMGNGTTRST